MASHGRHSHHCHSSASNFEPPPDSDPMIDPSEHGPAADGVRVHYPETDELDWSRPLYAWTFHQEQVYFNMFGHIAGCSASSLALLRAAHATNNTPECVNGSYRLLGEEIHKYFKIRSVGEEDKGGDMICVICHNSLNQGDDDFEWIVTLNCSHEYHTHCITRWLKQKNVCPVCNAMALPQQW